MKKELWRRGENAFNGLMNEERAWEKWPKCIHKHDE